MGRTLERHSAGSRRARRRRAVQERQCRPGLRHVAEGRHSLRAGRARHGGRRAVRPSCCRGRPQRVLRVSQVLQWTPVLLLLRQGLAPVLQVLLGPARGQEVLSVALGVKLLVRLQVQRPPRPWFHQPRRQLQPPRFPGAPVPAVQHPLRRIRLLSHPSLFLVPSAIPTGGVPRHTPNKRRPPSPSLSSAWLTRLSAWLPLCDTPRASSGALAQGLMRSVRPKCSNCFGSIRSVVC